MSFYKTFQEHILARVVDKEYNDVIGGIENHYYDTDELKPISKEDLKEDIINTILTCSRTLITEDFDALEPKHIRFIGKERIKEIVEHRVEWRYAHEQFPEAFAD